MASPSILSLLVGAAALLLFASVGAHGAVVIKQQNSTYVLVDTTYLLFELNHDTWYFYTKLPGGLLGTPLSARLAGYDERLIIRHNTDPCLGVDLILPLSNLTISLDPNSIPGVLQVILSGFSSTQNLCRLAMRFYLIDRPAVIEQAGKLVQLEPNQVKLSYEITGCTSYQAASRLFLPQWDPRNVSIIGRSGGPAIEFFGVTDNPLAVLAGTSGVDSLNTTNASQNWDSICKTNFTGLGQISSVPSGFNFSQEFVLVLRGSDYGFDYSVSWRFLRWAFSDNQYYNNPSLPFNLTGLLFPQPRGNGTAFWKIRFSVRSEFHNTVFYDPSFSVNTLFDLSAGETPAAATPATIAEAVGVSLGAAVGGTIGAVALVSIIAVFFLVPSVRRKILPYLQARKRPTIADDNLGDDQQTTSVQETSPTETQQQKQRQVSSSGAWSAGVARKSTMTNI